ncbi:MAG: site-specific integrase [Oligoflexia bacterium]|nr:site-specific integrase [Oligoflexia bacterium]
MAVKMYLDKNGNKLFEVYVTVRSPHCGRRQVRKRGLKSRRAAELQEFELKRELCDKRENPEYTWEEWHKLCVDRMKTEMRPSTILSYDLQLKKWVHPIWKERDIRSITNSDVHDLVFNRLEEAKPNSRKHILKMLKRIFNMAIEDRLLEHNPAVKIRVKVPDTKQVALNFNEANILLREAKLTNHRFFEIWALALFTGMRSGELYALRWNDIDFENRRICVSQSWCSKAGFGSTKSNRNRTVPISKELERLLKEMHLKSPKDQEFVLPHLQEWSHGEQAKVLRAFCKSIGITPVKFHDLRATFITQILLKGVPLAQVMSIVGHTELKTTNVYLRIIGSDLDGATEKLTFSLPPEGLAEVIDLNLRLGK